MSTIGEQDLRRKVEDSLARFDKAIRESISADDPRHEDQQFGASHGGLDDDTIAGISGDLSKGKPRCRPWNYDDFTERLRTFTSLGWFAKPLYASPPNCARFGWINQKRDVLVCSCCGAQLTFSRDEGDKAREVHGEAVDTSLSSPQVPRSFLTRLESEHHDLCPWKGNSSPVDFLHLPQRAHEDWRREFLERVRSIIALASSQALPEPALPAEFAECCPGGLMTLTRLVRKEESSAPPAARVSESERIGDGSRHNACPQLAQADDTVLGNCAAIAMFGWRSVSAHHGPHAADLEGQPRFSTTGVTDKGTSMHRLWCPICNRRVLMDNFLTADTRRTEERNSHPQAGEVSAKPAKRRRLSGGGTPLKPMDVVGEHRSFCPWARVHPSVPGQAGTAGVTSGWQQTLKALMALEHPSSNGEAESPGDSGQLRERASERKAKQCLDQVQRVLDVLMRY